MQIDITGLNIPITEELRELVDRRFDKISRQVSELATCEVLLSEERNPAIKAAHKAEANLQLKGVTLNAKAHALDMRTAVGQVVDELARQVDRRREKVRKVRKVGGETIRRADVPGPEPEGAQVE